MSRGLGTALTLSVLAHGGAVATVGVLGVAWLTGGPSASPPAALYVDLVHPVVAMSDRRAALDPAAPHSHGLRPGSPVASPTRRYAFDVAPPTQRPAAASVVPVQPETPAPGAPAAAPPPGVPESPAAPAARPAASPATAPGKQTPAPETAATASMTSPPPSFPAAPSPTEAAPRGATSDANVSPARPLSPSAPPGSSRDLETGDPGEGSGSLAGRDHGGSPAPTGESPLARLRSGEAQEGTPSDGAIPPEYESYVRSLRQRVQDRLVYPWAAVRRGQQGVIELEVRVGADGRLVAVEVVAGASAEPLRTAAVAAVRGSAPFPFPPGLAARPLVVRLPVEFRLR